MSFATMIFSFVMFVLGTIAVLGVMALVAWVTALLGALEAARPSAASPVENPGRQDACAVALPAPAAVTAPSTDGSIEPALVAVITAAVTATLQGRPFRIQNIQMAGTPVVLSTSWAQAGRQSLHDSHMLERKFR